MASVAFASRAGMGLKATWVAAMGSGCFPVLLHGRGMGFQFIFLLNSPCLGNFETAFFMKYHRG